MKNCDEKERDREGHSKISFNVLEQYYFVNLGKDRGRRGNWPVYTNAVSINWVRLHHGMHTYTVQNTTNSLVVISVQNNGGKMKMILVLYEITCVGERRTVSRRRPTTMSWIGGCQELHSFWINNFNCWL